MRTRFGLLTLATLVVAPGVPAIAGDLARPDPAQAQSASAERDAVQDIMFLADNRPVILRLHLTAGKKGFRDSWLDSVRTMHKYLDRDGDGKVTKTESEQGALPALVRLATGGATALPRTDLDTNPKDGEVSIDELADGLRTALGPFRIQVGRIATDRNDGLFIRLDRNKDGTLTKEELSAASASLHRLDLDEDELINAAELEPFTNPTAMQLEDVPGRRGKYATVPPVIELTPDDPSFKPVRLLLKRYDRGSKKGAKAGDNLLSHDELQIDRKVFAKGDTDSDGQLDTEELRRLLVNLAPDLELAVKLSGDSSGSASIEATGTGGKALPPAFKVQKLAGGDIEIAVGEVHLEFHVDDGIHAADDAKQYYMGQFSAADTDNNGYLEEKEMKDHTPLQPLFKLLDRDGDGKLYPKEVDTFVERQSEAAKSRMEMSAADQGRAIFAILDLNRDRKLGIREVRGTVTRVTSWDANGDGQVSSDEVPHHYQLTIGRARLSGVPTGQFARPMQQPEEAGSLASGPKWFQRMDRNRDGDVSRQEFLGPRTAFEKFDLDGDGLIDPAEAGKVDGKRSEKKVTQTDSPKK